METPVIQKKPLKSTHTNPKKPQQDPLNPKKKKTQEPEKNLRETAFKRTQAKTESPRNGPQIYPSTQRHTTLQHKVLSFATPSGRFIVAIGDRAMQIQKLPLTFRLLAHYHLVTLKFLFYGIPNGQRLIPKSTLQRPIQR
jgi:hypothetical protein